MPFFKLILALLLPIATSATSAFLTHGELHTAVRHFLEGTDAQKAAARTKYGSVMNDWDVSQITDFSRIFANLNTAVPLVDKWDVSKGTTFKHMFDMARFGFNMDLSSWDVSRSTDMNCMFCDSRDWNQDVGHWDGML